MSETSVSRAAESSREATHNSDRKKTSAVRKMGKRIKPSDSFDRQERHGSFNGSNLGSNRNVPDRKVSNRERVDHQVVEAQPNHIEATGPGHYEVGFDSKTKFVRHD